MERLKSFIFDIFMAIIIFFVVCLAGLVDIRSEQYPKDSPMMQEMRQSLATDQKYIENMGNKMIKETQEIDKLKKQIDITKSKGNKEEWNNNIINYNNKLSQRKKDMDEYKLKLEEYNKKYNQYKLLGEKNENVVKWVKSILGI
jgi:chromosome segregation ATPase